MDTATSHRDLSPVGPLWARLLLLAALLALGVGYLVAFAWLRAHSTDFIAARRNADAASRALAFDPALPQELEFRIGVPAGALLGVGWNALEEEGVWSLRADAVVQLHLPQPPQPLRLTLEAGGYLNSRHPRQQLELYLGDTLLGTSSASLDDGLHRLSVLLPVAVQTGAVLPLRLRTSHVGSPFRDDPAVRDSRQLGIKLLRIRIEAAALPP